MALMATTVGWLVAGAIGKTIAGLAAAVLTRIAAGSVASNFESRAILQEVLRNFSSRPLALATI